MKYNPLNSEQIDISSRLDYWSWEPAMTIPYIENDQNIMIRPSGA